MSYQTIQNIEVNNETFTIGTYNGLSITIRNKDKYVNASKMCNDVNKDFRTFCKSKRYKDIIEFWRSDRSAQICAYHNETVKYELKLGYDNDTRGQYIHPDLIHFVAEYCSVKYSFYVKHIMDSINNSIHDSFNKNNIEDTVDNSCKALDIIEKTIYNNKQMYNEALDNFFNPYHHEAERLQNKRLGIIENDWLVK